MARWEFKLPDIGEGVTEGEIVSWLVKPGEHVKEDQPMVEVMTDKATVTITSPKTGTIAELHGNVGQVVKVHAVLVSYDLGNGGTASTSASTSAAAAPSPSVAAAPTAQSAGLGTKAAGPAATAVGDIREDLPGMSLMRGSAPAEAPIAAAAPATSGYFAEKPLATPATRKLARDLEVDLRRVPPTGENGRVTRDDVQRFKGGAHANGHHAPAAPAAPAAAPPAPAAARAPVVIAPPAGNAQELEERVPFVGVRRKIAERMAQSKHTAAHFTFVEECDVTELKRVRERLRPHAEKAGVKLTPLAFIAKAVVAALARHPTLNSALDESTNELVIRKYVNLGIAAATDAGLMVPVVKDADRKSILELARDIERLGTGARDGKLKPQDLSGSTFTITSLGAQGGLFATPIINFPEVAILGVHQIKQKPVVRDGQIVIGEVMLLSLSFDHRIIDGHVGAAFAYEVIGYLQEPDRLLLEG
ncbi:MAG: 2-oxo acid dehydrogenase subunit E2 [Deltaproteobacteria bacterium]|nr:2-oxo acid dehydrogenase subunit E2 [Deltaproteobacteria bacterium]